MNEEAQLRDNLSAANDAAPNMLTQAEVTAYAEVLDIFKQTDKIPCTGCSYCMPCPGGVNIPACFASYNASYTHGRITSLSMYITSTAANRNAKSLASSCIQCGKCESHCPQKIEIRRSRKDVAKRMEPFYFNIIMKVMRSRGKRKQRQNEQA
jgi:predicted aldo/keto reductase-like oxidoreductase